MPRKTVKLKKELKDAIKFIGDSFRPVNIGNVTSPFFWKWFNGSLVAIGKTKPKGLKEKELYSWEVKRIYALLMVGNPKFSRKHFSEIFRISYGTARNWKKDKEVNNIVTSLAIDFVDRYIERVKEILSSPQGEMSLAEYIEKRNADLHKLFSEAVFYKYEFVFKYLEKRIRNLPKEEDNPIPELMTALAVSAFYRIVGDYYGVYDDPEKKKEYIEGLKADVELGYMALRTHISFALKGKLPEESAKELMEYTGVLEMQTKKYLDDICFLDIELSKARGKRAKRRSTKEKPKV